MTHAIGGNQKMGSNPYGATLRDDLEVNSLQLLRLVRVARLARFVGHIGELRMLVVSLCQAVKLLWVIT